MKGARFIFYFMILIVLGLQGCLSQPAIPMTGSNASALNAAVPQIQSVEVLQSDSPQQVVLVVQVVLPNTCLQLGDAAVDRQGQVFNVSLPGVKAAGQSCQPAAVSQSQVVRLPVNALAPGSYIALVNGYLSSFQLTASGKVQPVAVQTQQTVVAAAAAAAPTATPQPTLPPTATATEAPMPAEAFIAQPTPTPTPLALPVGQDKSKCSNKAALYGSLTIPDGTPFAPGSKFTKTWLVLNAGTCAWGPGYNLVFAGGDPLGAQQKVPLPSASPKQVVQVSVNMTAPIPAGSYESDWAIETPDGYIFGLSNPPVVPLVAKISVVQLPAGLPSGLDCGALRMQDLEQKTLQVINATRAQYGLYPYVLKEDISLTALKHSLEQACYNRESHFGLDGNLYNVRLQRDNILFATSNEIIYSGNGGPDAAIKWWMNSPIHHAIVLSNKYTEAGVGFVFYSKNPYVYRITVDFIHP